MLVVSHISWSGAELGVGLDHLIDCIEEVLLSGNLQCNNYNQDTACHVNCQSVINLQHN